MSSPIPTIEELGVEEWVQKNQKNGDTSGSKVFARPLDKSEKQRQEEYTMFNGILTIAFLMPAVFAKLIGLPLGFFHYPVYAMIHEAGHGIMCLLSSRFICSAAGTLNEMIFSLAPALICFRTRETYVAACVLMMCAGLSIQNAGTYMQSAEHPRGRGFAGVPLNANTHDWTIMLTQFNLVGESFDLGQKTEAVGSALAVIFFTASLVAVIPSLYGWSPQSPSDIIAPSAATSLIYLLYIGAKEIELLIAVLFAAPLILKAFKGIR